MLVLPPVLVLTLVLSPVLVLAPAPMLMFQFKRGLGATTLVAKPAVKPPEKIVLSLLATPGFNLIGESFLQKCLELATHSDALFMVHAVGSDTTWLANMRRHLMVMFAGMGLNITMAVRHETLYRCLIAAAEVCTHLRVQYWLDAGMACLSHMRVFLPQSACSVEQAYLLTTIAMV